MVEVVKPQWEFGADNEPDEVVEDHFFSTGCYHERHDECKLSCKYCGSPCYCGCHTVE